MTIHGFRDADGKEVQPYFAAFMIENGHKRISDARNFDYIIWNGRMWSEFEAQHDDLKGPRFQYAKAFAAWLDNRVCGMVEDA